MPVEMKIKGLMFDPVSRMPIVILKDASGEHVLPIWVGLSEAHAIASEIEKTPPPRPMTHDLLRNVIEAFKGGVERVVITDLREGTYFALIHMRREQGPFEMDARPSDAMALALRVHAPIFVEPEVLEKSTGASDDPSVGEADRLRRWLEKADPEELGSYEM